jgi:hypothetical protein
MAEATPMDNIKEAMMEMQCISEIMTELGENATRDNGMLPATWMIWLGGCVSNAVAKVSEAVDSPRQTKAANGSHQSV